MSGQTSATLLRIQDKIMANSMAALRLLAGAAPNIIAADRLCEQLRNDDIKAEVVDTVDESGCSVCVVANGSRISTVSEALASHGYSYQLVDQHSSHDYRMATWAVNTGDQTVYVAVMHPLAAAEARAAA